MCKDENLKNYHEYSFVKQPKTTSTLPLFLGNYYPARFPIMLLLIHHSFFILGHLMATIGRTFKLQTFSEKIASYPESFMLQSDVKSCLYPPSLKLENMKGELLYNKGTVCNQVQIRRPKRVAVWLLLCHFRILYIWVWGNSPVLSKLFKLIVVA